MLLIILYISGCYDDAEINPAYLVDCEDDQDVCLLSIEVDWYRDGHQERIPK